MITNADAGPQMTQSITQHEQDIAKKVKEELKLSLKELDEAVKTVVDLRNAIVEQRPSRDDLKTKYHGRLLRYRTKISNSFNTFLVRSKQNIELINQILDPDMMRLRDIFIAELHELSDGVEALLDLLGDTQKEGFTKTLEQIAAQLEKRSNSITDVIDHQIIHRVEQDILGKMKISNLRFRIKKRARIIKQLLVGE